MLIWFDELYRYRGGVLVKELRVSIRSKSTRVHGLARGAELFNQWNIGHNKFRRNKLEDYNDNNKNFSVTEEIHIMLPIIIITEILKGII